MRFDWSTTDLGPIDSWPQSLKTAVELMMATPLPMVMVWGDKRLMIYNDLYAAFAGKRHPQALGAAVRDIWPEITDINAGIINRVIAGESITLEGEKRVLFRKDVAEDVWINLHYAAVRDENGTGVAAMITVIETTEKRAMELQLKAREELFRTMAESIPNHAWTGGPDGMLDWFNQRVYDYTGAKPSALNGERWGSVVHPDDLPRAGAAWSQSLSDGSPYEVEFRLRGHDGAYAWFLARALPIRDDTGRIVRWVGTNTDISRQREIEEAQRALNRTLEMRIAERTADRDRMWRLSQDLMIVVNDRPGVTIVAVNPAWQRLLGWTEAELLGRSAIDFVHPDDMSIARSAAQPYIEMLSVDGRPVRRYENRYRHKDGSWRWISWTVVADDDILQGVGRDVTAEKAHAEALTVAEAQLRQAHKMEAVGQLTGGIAHDFNNMLAVVIGSLGLLKRRLAKGDTNIAFLAENALDGATRAASLTHRLLAFSRQQPLKLEAIEANQLVSGMLELMVRTLGETILIETALDSTLWQAHTDPHQLENAVLNLAVNARDAMPDGGALTVETANVTVGPRDIAAHPGMAAGEYVSITVRDTGVGMEPEVVARAFDPFFTTKEVGKGTGLGLSQVYGFAQQSGGHVAIDSKPGHGTAVRLYLPRRAGAAESIREKPAPAAPRAPATIAILVVEDEPAVRRSSADALTELGYPVLEADSAAAALKTLEAHPEIALMFTDIVMPEIDGARLAELAKLQRPNLKILFTTGHTRDTVIRNEPLDPGANLIAKPFTSERLAAKLREVLAR